MSQITPEYLKENLNNGKDLSDQSLQDLANLLTEEEMLDQYKTYLISFKDVCVKGHWSPEHHPPRYAQVTE